MDDAMVQRLMLAARAAREQAYAPYSGFAVGAALLDEQGRVHPGCNVENAAYPQGVCAEAGALSVLVLAQSSRPVTPCGGCRQKLREFAADDVPVLVADGTAVVARYTLGELLPASFGPEHLPAKEQQR